MPTCENGGGALAITARSSSWAPVMAYTAHFRPQGYKRVGITQVEVYERVGTSVA